ncbi:hypothetical protein QOT17_004495 [Balamuthia mandrillaris]
MEELSYFTILEQCGTREDQEEFFSSQHSVFFRTILKCLSSLPASATSAVTSPSSAASASAPSAAKAHLLRKSGSFWSRRLSGRLSSSTRGTKLLQSFSSNDVASSSPSSAEVNTNSYKNEASLTLAESVHLLEVFFAFVSTQRDNCSFRTWFHLFLSEFLRPLFPSLSSSSPAAASSASASASFSPPTGDESKADEDNDSNNELQSQITPPRTEGDVSNVPLAVQSCICHILHQWFRSATRRADLLGEPSVSDSIDEDERAKEKQRSEEQDESEIKTNETDNRRSSVLSFLLPLCQSIAESVLFSRSGRSSLFLSKSQSSLVSTCFSLWYILCMHTERTSTSLDYILPFQIAFLQRLEDAFSLEEPPEENDSIFDIHVACMELVLEMVKKAATNPLPEDVRAKLEGMLLDMTVLFRCRLKLLDSPDEPRRSQDYVLRLKGTLAALVKVSLFAWICFGHRSNGWPPLHVVLSQALQVPAVLFSVQDCLEELALSTENFCQHFIHYNLSWQRKLESLNTQQQQRQQEQKRQHATLSINNSNNNKKKGETTLPDLSSLVMAKGRKSKRKCLRVLPLLGQHIKKNTSMTRSLDLLRSSPATSSGESNRQRFAAEILSDSFPLGNVSKEANAQAHLSSRKVPLQHIATFIQRILEIIKEGCPIMEDDCILLCALQGIERVVDILLSLLAGCTDTFVVLLGDDLNLFKLLPFLVNIFERRNERKWLLCCQKALKICCKIVLTTARSFSVPPSTALFQYYRVVLLALREPELRGAALRYSREFFSRRLPATAALLSTYFAAVQDILTESGSYTKKELGAAVHILCAMSSYPNHFLIHDPSSAKDTSVEVSPKFVYIEQGETTTTTASEKDIIKHLAEEFQSGPQHGNPPFLQLQHEIRELLLLWTVRTNTTTSSAKKKARLQANTLKALTCMITQDLVFLCRNRQRTEEEACDDDNDALNIYNYRLEGALAVLETLKQCLDPKLYDPTTIRTSVACLSALTAPEFYPGILLLDENPHYIIYSIVYALASSVCKTAPKDSRLRESYIQGLSEWLQLPFPFLQEPSLLDIVARALEHSLFVSSSPSSASSSASSSPSESRWFYSLLSDRTKPTTENPLPFFLSSTTEEERLNDDGKRKTNNTKGIIKFKLEDDSMLLDPAMQRLDAIYQKVAAKSLRQRDTAKHEEHDSEKLTAEALLLFLLYSYKFRQGNEFCEGSELDWAALLDNPSVRLQYFYFDSSLLFMADMPNNNNTDTNRECRTENKQKYITVWNAIGSFSYTADTTNSSNNHRQLSTISPPTNQENSSSARAEHKQYKFEREKSALQKELAKLHVLTETPDIDQHRATESIKRQARQLSRSNSLGDSGIPHDAKSSSDRDVEEEQEEDQDNNNEANLPLPSHSHLALYAGGTGVRPKPLFFESRKQVERSLRFLSSSSGKTSVKIGLLYVKEGQTFDRDMLANNTYSHDFGQFITRIAAPVNLQTHKGYAGGLDKRDIPSDIHFPYHQTFTTQTIFHVAPLIPSTAGDANQIQRKRHLGNDTVVVVWSEHNTDFSPQHFRSSFTSVFIVIYPLSNYLYRIRIHCKQEDMLVYPLADEMIVGKEVLAPLVRETAIRAHMEAFRDQHFFTTAFARQQTFIQEIIRRNASPSTQPSSNSSFDQSRPSTSATSASLPLSPFSPVTMPSVSLLPSDDEEEKVQEELEVSAERTTTISELLLPSSSKPRKHQLISTKRFSSQRLEIRLQNHYLKNVDLQTNSLSSQSSSIPSLLFILPTTPNCQPRLLNLTFLRTLQLDHNHLYTLPPELVYITPHLEHLSLSHNRFSTFPSRVVLRLRFLKSLNLSFNQLDTLPADLPSRLSRLESLSLESNRLSFLPSTYYYLFTAPCNKLGNNPVINEREEEGDTERLSPQHHRIKLILDNNPFKHLCGIGEKECYSLQAEDEDVMKKTRLPLHSFESEFQMMDNETATDRFLSLSCHSIPSLKSHCIRHLLLQFYDDSSSSPSSSSLLPTDLQNTVPRELIGSIERAMQQGGCGGCCKPLVESALSRLWTVPLPPSFFVGSSSCSSCCDSNERIVVGLDACSIACARTLFSALHSSFL